MRRCKSCDAGLNSEAAKCPRCGTLVPPDTRVNSPVIVSGPMIPPAATPSLPDQASTNVGSLTGTVSKSASPSKWPWIAVIILLIVVVVLLVKIAF